MDRGKAPRIVDFSLEANHGERASILVGLGALPL